MKTFKVGDIIRWRSATRTEITNRVLEVSPDHMRSVTIETNNPDIFKIGEILNESQEQIDLWTLVRSSKKVVFEL
jgi:hypothetical protein